MTNCQNEMKRAVEAGYWNMFRFDPRKKAEGKNPFTIDSKAPTADYKEFIESETRYSRLQRASPSVRRCCSTRQPTPRRTATSTWQACQAVRIIGTSEVKQRAPRTERCGALF